MKRRDSSTQCPSAHGPFANIGREALCRFANRTWQQDMGRNVLASNPKGIYMSNVVICIFGIIGSELKVNSILYVFDQVLINMSPQIFKPL